MVPDLSQAVCVGSLSPSAGLSSRFPALGPPAWPPRRYPCPPSSHARPAPLPLPALRAAATAARGTCAPRAGSTPDPALGPPAPAGRGAPAWPSPCRSWARAAARAGVSWQAATQNWQTPAPRTAAAASRPHPATRPGDVAPSPPHAAASCGCSAPRRPYGSATRRPRRAAQQPRGCPTPREDCLGPDAVAARA